MVFELWNEKYTNELYDFYISFVVFDKNEHACLLYPILDFPYPSRENTAFTMSGAAIYTRYRPRIKSSSSYVLHLQSSYYLRR